MNIVKKIRHIIRWFSPYGVVRRYAKKKRGEKSSMPELASVNFMSKFKKYRSTDNHVELHANSPYKAIVSVQGFGFSGSGAVLDLLREYQSNQVLGFVDVEGSLVVSNSECEEVDLLRLSGGLFEVEKYIDSKNIFQNDALLHRLIALIEQSSVYKCYPQTHPYFYEFIHQICQPYENESSIQFYNPHLDYKGNNDILFLKPLVLDDYRALSRKLLNSLFSVIKGNKNASYLVLDQIISDCEFDSALYKQYIPNLRSIVVYRDPRDIYVYAKHSHENWIPSYDVDLFVGWYRTITKQFNISECQSYMVVQFERLLTDYEEQVKSIELYIGLDTREHIHMKQCFNPEVSKNNMRIYKNYPEYASDCEVIEKELSSLCYN